MAEEAKEEVKTEKKMTRRRMLDANKLLRKYHMVKSGELDVLALGLAVNYLDERDKGETELLFDVWLDGEFTPAELTDEEEDTDPLG